MNAAFTSHNSSHLTPDNTERGEAVCFILAPLPDSLWRETQIWSIMQIKQNPFCFSLRSDAQLPSLASALEKKKPKTNNFKSEPHLPIYASILGRRARWKSHAIIPPIGRAESDALMSYFPQERVACSHVSDEPVVLRLSFPCLMCSAWIFA